MKKMKLKIEGKDYKVEIGLRDDYFQKRYGEDARYVKEVFHHGILTGLSHLYVGELAQEALRELESDFAERRITVLEAARIITESLDDVVDPKGSN